MAKKKPAKKTTKKTAPPAKKSGGGAKSAASKSAPKTTKKTTKKVAKKTAKKVVKKVTKKKVAPKTTAKTTKKVVKKKAAAKTTKKVSPKPTTPKKKTTKKKTTKKAASKPVKKTASKTTKKKIVKKVEKKVTAKTATKTTKKVVKKAASKAPTKTPAKTPAKGSKPTTKTSAPAATKPGDKKADGTKPAAPVRRRTRSSKAKKPLVLPDRPLLLGPNSAALKPLIATGSKVKQKKSVLDNVTSRRTKTPLTKSQLEAYRMTLLQKRAELLGDVRHLEEEALGVPGSVNTKSKHADEQGSESYEQSLSLNLAASDRKMINEIDDALARIDDRTFGLCEVTFEPIKKARLDELPWARHTIHAAREIDRRGGA